MDRTAPARSHLDRRLARLRPVEELARPPRGWIRAVRDALGMSAAQMSHRLGVSQPRVLAMEKAEERGAITLATLERAAQALGCTLVYALVPNIPLEEMVWQRARKLAAERLAHVDHSMRLEDQGVGAETLDAARERLAGELLGQNVRRLWDER